METENWTKLSSFKDRRTILNMYNRTNVMFGSDDEDELRCVRTTVLVFPLS